MIFLSALVFIICLICFPTFRCAVFNIHHVLINGCRDLYFYFLHKQYNLCHTGELVAYVGLFGKGKTLSVVHRVVSSYNHYNGKLVWCPRRKRLVRQRVRVISNVSLKIPYEDFTGLQQVVDAGPQNAKYDDENDTLTVTLVLGDEFSVQMNSRNFKTNIDPLFLNTILTCRHYYISLYYTAQRFCHVDALLRQVTSCVIDCNKLWRFQRLAKYDAWDMENATNVQLIQPLARTCWFVRNRDYEAYDTLACVGNLEHAMKKGEMISEKEILDLQQGNQGIGMDGVTRPSKSFQKRKKGK